MQKISMKFRETIASLKGNYLVLNEITLNEAGISVVLSGQS